jgi:Ca-activated chloride channel family protein
MTFIWGKLLWLLAIIPVLIGAYLLAQRRRKKYALRYSSLSLVKEALGRGPGVRRHIPAVLFFLGLTVMIVALARPAASVLLPSERGTVILAIDISGSMRAQDIKPSRIDAAKAAARAFIQRQPGSVRIGIVAFGGSASLVQAPVTDRDQLYAAIDRLRTQRSTAIGSGLLVSLDAIFENPAADNSSRAASPTQPLMPAQQDQSQAAPPPVPPGSYKSAVIVLLSDGQSNTGPDPLDIADQAANRGVRVFTVGVGTPQGALIGMEGFSFRVFLDENTLKQIAAKTGGSYFRAEDENQLKGIYEALSTRLIVEKSQTEITAIFTAVAAALLLVAGSLSLLWFSRLP